MAFMAIIMGLRLLFYILLGFREGAFRFLHCALARGGKMSAV